MVIKYCKNIGILSIIMLTLSSLNQNVFAEEGVLLDSSTSSIEFFKKDIPIYKEKEFKIKEGMLDANIPIEVLSKTKDYICIKHDEEIYFIKKADFEENVNTKDVMSEEKLAIKEGSEQNNEDQISISETDGVSDIQIASFYTEQIKSSNIGYNSQKQEEFTSGERLNALFTSYYPENSLLQGGYFDALGKLLNPGDNTIAAPKEIPFGTQVQIQGTNTDMDGRIFTVRDRGGAIKKRGDQYQFDILSPDRKTAYSWGRRTGYVRIVRWGW